MDIAGEIAAVRVFLLYAVDPLDAVPLEDFRTTSALHTVRRQLLASVKEKRAIHRKLARAGRTIAR